MQFGLGGSCSRRAARRRADHDQRDPRRGGAAHLQQPGLALRRRLVAQRARWRPGRSSAAWTNQPRPSSGDGVGPRRLQLGHVPQLPEDDGHVAG